MAKNTKKNRTLLDPGAVLSGRQLARAAEAATRIEFRPVISAHRRELAQIARARRRDDRGLAKLGRKTIGQMKGTYQGTNNLMRRGIQAASALGDDLQGASQANVQGAQARMDALQGGVLGGQIDSLSAAGIQPGQSASQNALAAAAAQAQAGQAGLADAFGDVASTMATGMKDTARNRLAANQMARAQAVTSARGAVASRRMASRAAYGDAESEVRGSLRNARSLRGATKMNNLMRLRDSERGFINERAALMLDAREAAQDYKLGKEKNDIDRDGGGGGGGGGGNGGDPLEPEDAPRRLQPFWPDWLRAANQVRDGEPIQPGFWNEFLDKMEEQKNLDWSPTQRAKFLKQYKKWYKKNVGS